mgnify:CR=1 FL=1
MKTWTFFGNVSNQDDTLISAKETELLLRHGAYHLLSQPEDELDSESKRFMEEDIDTILLRRSKKKVHNEAQSSSTSFQKLLKVKIKTDGQSRS